MERILFGDMGAVFVGKLVATPNGCDGEDVPVVTFLGKTCRWRVWGRRAAGASLQQGVPLVGVTFIYGGLYSTQNKLDI